MESIILPDAAWRNRPGLARLTEILGDGQARYVGGAVRDTLLNLPVADVDIATPLRPETAMERLKDAGIKVVPTGLRHGTITAVLEGGPVEVTTLRHDISTDGRHAVVAYTDDWEADAARRDFTMNALYADPASGRIFDYFGGLSDLAERRVRFIGDPMQRIAEDHLRILRFFRFLARFGDAPDPQGLEACAARANDLMALSRERIADELLKLLVAKAAPRIVALMVEHGIFRPVLPEIGIAGAKHLSRLAGAEQQAGISPDPIRRLAALLPPEKGVAEAVGARLKLSRAQQRRLVSATGTVDAPPEALAYRLGIDTAIDRLLLHQGDDDAIRSVRHLKNWQVPRFPLTGGAIVARGVAKGPEVARLLQRAEAQWIAEGFPDASRVETIADHIVNQESRKN
ncbi:CCA tRNA nucleotidyltransferase [Stakelama sediminis]|uniref:Poly(A) polymerase n=1 Tax=Stakelama sediminis TaxID=463200 RepID=A0A840YZR4_9SPHN|nr:CCA tRNA nucleotidyltransferase [Stakelama sediminis]MBB5718982.1 poly(A) polymerase [Stakelama sediminis]